MKQLPLLFEKKNPRHVCKSKTEIYGLRQALQAWYNALSSFLLEYGFKNSLADKLLFIFNQDGVHVFMLTYVDDLILIGDNT